MKKIIKFWANGCPPCKMYEPVFDKVSKEYSNNDLFFESIDARNDKTGLREVLNVKSIPHTFILNENNEVLKDKRGYMDENGLKSFIESI